MKVSSFLKILSVFVCSTSLTKSEHNADLSSLVNSCSRVFLIGLLRKWISDGLRGPYGLTDHHLIPVHVILSLLLYPFVFWRI